MHPVARFVPFLAVLATALFGFAGQQSSAHAEGNIFINTKTTLQGVFIRVDEALDVEPVDCKGAPFRATMTFPQGTVLKAYDRESSELRKLGGLEFVGLCMNVTDVGHALTMLDLLSEQIYGKYSEVNWTVVDDIDYRVESEIQGMLHELIEGNENFPSMRITRYIPPAWKMFRIFAIGVASY